MSTQTVSSIVVTRDMPDRSRVVAHLEVRLESGRLSPAFSLTGNVFEPHGNLSGGARAKRYARLLASGANTTAASEPDASGCVHDDIMRAFPSLARFEAMHLSDQVTGEPMHALANAWYFYAGGRAYAARVLESERNSATAPVVHYVPEVYAWRLEEMGLPDSDAGCAEYCYRTACNTLRVDNIPRELDRASFGRFVDDLRELWAHEAADARAVIAVAALLQTDNPREPEGTWSVWDLSAASGLDALTVRRALRMLPVTDRYVGGTSGSLYGLHTVTASWMDDPRNA